MSKYEFTLNYINSTCPLFVKQTAYIYIIVAFIHFLNKKRKDFYTVSR